MPVEWITFYQNRDFYNTREYMRFSQDDVCYILINFKYRLRVRKMGQLWSQMLNLCRLRYWKKIVRPRPKFFESIPQLANPPNETSPTGPYPN